MQAHYPKWKLTCGLPQIFTEIADAWHRRMAK
jgi:hypothetical protein